MLSKKVYVNDQLIGEARTWSEVHALIKKRGIRPSGQLRRVRRAFMSAVRCSAISE